MLASMGGRDPTATLATHSKTSCSGHRWPVQVHTLTMSRDVCTQTVFSHPAATKQYGVTHAEATQQASGQMSVGAPPYCNKPVPASVP